MTLRGLGAAAGVSRMAPYRHFADKEELLASVAANGMRALREAMVQASQSGGTTREQPGARVEAVLNAYAEAALSQPAHYQLIFGAELSGREHPQLIAEGSAAFELLAEFVRDAHAACSEEPESPVTTTALLWSAVHGVVDLTLSGHASADKGLADPRLADPRAVIRLAVTQTWPPSAVG